MLQGTCRTQSPVKQEFWPSCQKHQRSSILSGSLLVKKVVCPNHEKLTDRHARLALEGKPGFSRSCKKDQLSSILSGSPHVKKVVCPNHENMTDIQTHIYIYIYIYIYISERKPSWIHKCLRSGGALDTYTHIIFSWFGHTTILTCRDPDRIDDSWSFLQDGENPGFPPRDNLACLSVMFSWFGHATFLSYRDPDRIDDSWCFWQDDENYCFTGVYVLQVPWSMIFRRP